MVWLLSDGQQPDLLPGQLQEIDFPDPESRQLHRQEMCHVHLDPGKEAVKKEIHFEVPD